MAKRLMGSPCTYSVPSADAGDGPVAAQTSPLAIVHEWVQARAGSEQVFETIARSFENADLFALSVNPKIRLEVDNRPIATTWLNHPMLRERRGVTLPLMPLAWRGLGKAKYDAVISSHHAFAHSNRLAAQGGVHLSYVYSPARYVWSPEIDERGSSALLAPMRSFLKSVDLRAVARVTAFAAISAEIANRIEKYWNRPAVVIHPSARVEYFRPTSGVATQRGYVLGVGRWIPYKNLHLVIAAASIAGMPVKVAGRGPDKPRIVAEAERAGVPVELIESPSDEQLRELYQGASVLVFPTMEDFGIVPVEAQAAGTPVVALGAGGALDTVIDGVTGVLTASVDPVELAAGIEAAMALNPADCMRNAENFSRARFQVKIRDWAASHGVSAGPPAISRARPA
jgi:glycosyltransferase involved in cell wall biosynthesis